MHFRRCGPAFGSLPALIAVAAALFALPALAAPGGELDASFGGNGMLAIGGAGNTHGQALAQQPADGKILVAGYVKPDGAKAHDFFVKRLNPDGSQDSTFASAGGTSVDFGGADDYATELALQPDGKIVVAGHAHVGLAGRGNDFAILRLTPDGWIDSSFDGDGRLLLDLGGDDETIAGITLLPNGKIVVAGTTNANGRHEVAFARFEANGKLDNTFGTGPVAGTTLVGSTGREFTASAIVRQSDGKLVACGASDRSQAAGESKVLAVRVNTDGSLDTGFGVGGIAVINTSRTFSGARSCVAMSDGTVTLAGFHGEPGNSDLALIRLAPDGQLDTTFGNSGVASIDLGGIDSIQAIIVLQDGGLAATGISAVHENGSGQSDMFLASIDATSGALNPFFGNQGITIADYGYADLESVARGRDLLQQADGKLLAVGTHEYHWWWDTIPVMALMRVSLAGAGNAGVIGFKEIFVDITEGTPEVVVNVRRTGGSLGDVSVDYQAHARSNPEAQPQSDFTATAGTLFWASGDMQAKPITVPIIDDALGEAYERFNIALSNSTNPLTLEYVVVGITDNDASPPPPSPAPPSGGNPAGGAGGGGGGGATGVELLLLLPIVAALAKRRRPGRYRAGIAADLLDTISAKP
jgi:uncharacterized delta-60 repeat protein